MAAKGASATLTVKESERTFPAKSVSSMEKVCDPTCPLVGVQLTIPEVLLSVAPLGPLTRL